MKREMDESRKSPTITALSDCQRLRSVPSIQLQFNRLTNRSAIRSRSPKSDIIDRNSTISWLWMQNKNNKSLNYIGIGWGKNNNNARSLYVLSNNPTWPWRLNLPPSRSFPLKIKRSLDLSPLLLSNEKVRSSCY